MSVELPVALGGLPVPEVHLPQAVPGHQELPIWREADLAGVAGVVVSCEGLLVQLAHLLARRVDHDLVVHALSRDEGAGGVRGHRGNAVHARVRNVLDRHGDVELPHEDFLVVAGGHELAAAVDEGDGVAGLQVVVVLLHHLSGADVPLVKPVVTARGDEHVVVSRVVLHVVRHLAVRKGAGGLTGLHIPVPQQAVEAAAQKVRAVVAHVDGADGLAVARVSALYGHLAAHCVPDLALAVHRS